MRVIKFRAWHKEDKKMYGIYIIDFVYETIDLLSELNNQKSEVRKSLLSNVNLMQFAGLSDKNGKEIYEGDILEVYKELKVIKWDEVIAGFSWRNCSMDNYLMFRKYVAENCEIKGNIYENPDLIVS